VSEELLVSSSVGLCVCFLVGENITKCTALRIKFLQDSASGMLLLRPAGELIIMVSGVLSRLRLFMLAFAFAILRVRFILIMFSEY
jgi:hypothetical protein